MQRHERVLDFLSRIAYDNAPHGGARCAAAVVHKRKIISVGCNQHRTHPFAARFQKNSDAIFLHAETDAIRKSLNHLSLMELAASTLYICRVTADGKMGISKPCLGCTRAVTQFEIKKVYYTTGIGKEYLEL